MWVTQTYLGSPDPEAEVFVYYLYLEYDSKQKAFTHKLQLELEKLGDVFGGKVSLQMPSPRYAGKVEAEVRENRVLWEAVCLYLPGLLVSKVPLSKIKDYNDSCVLVSFEKLAETPTILGLLHAVSQVKILADNTIAWKQTQSQSEAGGFFDRLGDSLELKPGVFGIRVDLRKLFRR